MLTTFLIAAVCIVAAGITLAFLVKTVKNVTKKAGEQGVDLSDGLQGSEAAIIARLIAQEMAESAELEALERLRAIMNKAVDRKLAKAESQAAATPPAETPKV